MSSGAPEARGALSGDVWILSWGGVGVGGWSSGSRVLEVTGAIIFFFEARSESRNGTQSESTIQTTRLAG